MELDESQVHNQTLYTIWEECKREIQEKNNSIDTLRKRLDIKRLIDSPKKNMAQIESALKLGCKFTMNNIIDYLKLDSYEFVKTIWGVITSDNAVESIAYVDGALQRNEALIKALKKYSEEKKVPEFLGKKKL